MGADKRTAANRANATCSTGPRTAAGKAIAARNATRHGIFARALLLPGEDAAALDQLGAALFAELAPAGALERVWAEQVVECVWKRRRLDRLERGIVAFYLNERVAQQAQDGDLRELPPAERLAAAFIADGHRGDQLGKLARYQASLERMLVRALHELERLQARRRGEPVAPPVAVDVTVAAPDGEAPRARAERAGGAPGGGVRDEIGLTPWRNEPEPAAAAGDAAAGGAGGQQPPRTEEPARGVPDAPAG